MERMLQGYKNKVVSNKDDIGSEVDQFMKEQSTATKEINRLHFHFSGHGVYNAKVLLEDSKKLKTETEETETPNGNCIVGTTGELFSVHDLKVKLLGNALKPRVETRGSKVTVKTITITLDCCNELRRRDLRGESEEKPKPKERQLKLKHQDIISISDQMKIAVMNCAPEGHYVHDNDSFTKSCLQLLRKEPSPFPSASSSEKSMKFGMRMPRHASLPILTVMVGRTSTGRVQQKPTTLSRRNRRKWRSRCWSTLCGKRTQRDKTLGKQRTPLIQRKEKVKSVLSIFCNLK